MVEKVLRQDLISRGVAFMRNPKVASTEMSKKIAFLEGKGLTFAELTEILKICSGGNMSASPATSQPPTTDSIEKVITKLRAQLQPESEREAIRIAINALEYVLQQQQKEDDAVANKHAADPCHDNDNDAGVVIAEAESHKDGDDNIDDVS